MQFERGQVVSFKDAFVKHPEAGVFGRRGRYLVTQVTAESVGLDGIDYEGQVLAKEHEVQPVMHEIRKCHGICYTMTCTMSMMDDHVSEFRNVDRLLPQVEDALHGGWNVQITQEDVPVPVSLKGYQAFLKAMGRPTATTEEFLETLRGSSRQEQDQAAAAWEAQHQET